MALTLTYLTVYVTIVVGLLRVRTPVTVVLTLVRDILPTRLERLMRPSDPRA